MSTRWIYDDGGRADAGYPDTADGDCVTRAIAIATGLGYRQAHDLVDGIGVATALWYPDPLVRPDRLGFKSADIGVHPIIFHRVLQKELGWLFTRTEGRFGLRGLPAGRIIVQLRSGSEPHVCAVIDRVIHDVWDCSEAGRATISGYYTPPPPLTM